MPTDLARATAYIGLLTSNQLTDQQIQLMFNLAHMEEVESRSWARLQTDFTFNSFALYSTGSVTVTQGSPIITGSGTAWTTSMIDMVLNVGVAGANGTATQIVPIPIDSVDPVGQVITLRSPYPQGGGTKLGYQIFPMFYEIVGMQRVAGVRQQINLGKSTHAEINIVDPYRSQSASPATNWAPFGQNHNGNMRIELWPTETAANPYSVYGFKGHVDLVNPTDTPLLPAAVVINKTLGKCCEVLYSLGGDSRWVTQRDFYYSRYDAELQGAINTDREEFGVVGQVRDSIGDPDSGSYTPGLDAIYNRDIGGY